MRGTLASSRRKGASVTRVVSTGRREKIALKKQESQLNQRFVDHKKNVDFM